MLGTLKPKMPTIYRVRSDLTWEDVVHNWKEKKLPSIKGEEIVILRTRGGSDFLSFQSLPLNELRQMGFGRMKKTVSDFL